MSDLDVFKISRFYHSHGNGEELLLGHTAGPEVISSSTDFTLR